MNNSKVTGVNVHGNTCEFKGGNSSEKLSKTYQEGGWGWVIVSVSFMVHVSLGGISAMYGILNIELMALTDLRIDDVSWISSICIGTTCILAPFCSQLSNSISSRFLLMVGGGIGFCGIFISSFVSTPWLLYIMLGLMPGIGSSLGLISSLTIVSRYFEKKRSIAIAVVVSGGGLGTFVFPILISFLLQKFTLQGTLQIVSGFLLNWMVFGAAYFPPHSKDRKVNNRSSRCYHFFKELTDKTLLTDTRFVSYFLANLIIFLVYGVPLLFLPIKGLENGYSLEKTAIWISIFGVLSCVGRLVIGKAVTLMPNGQGGITLICIFSCAISVFCMSFTSNYTLIAAYSAVYGFFTGCFIAVVPVIAIETFGVEKHNAIGYLYFGQGIGILIGPPVAGFLTVRFQNTDIAFYFAAGCMLITCFVLLPVIIPGIPCIQRRKNIHTIKSYNVQEKTKEMEIWSTEKANSIIESV